MLSRGINKIIAASIYLICIWENLFFYILEMSKVWVKKWLKYVA